MLPVPRQLRPSNGSFYGTERQSRGHRLGRSPCLLRSTKQGNALVLCSPEALTPQFWGCRKEGRLALGLGNSSGWFQVKAVLQGASNLLLGFCPSRCCFPGSPTCRQEENSQIQMPRASGAGFSVG